MDKWVKIKDEAPQYYETVSIRQRDGHIVNAWRASDGENDIYTVTGTDITLDCDMVIEWKPIPRYEYISFTKYNLRDDNVQAFLKSNEFPLYRDMVKRGTDQMDRIFYFILFQGNVIGYMVTTTNSIAHEEQGYLKYDAVHIHQIELLSDFKGNGFGADAIKALGIQLKSDTINKVSLVGKNDYLTLYYKSIGFSSGETGVLYRKIR